MQISRVGLGKVGLSLASCLTAAGHQVWGADVDPSLIDALNRREFHTSEPGVLDGLTPPFEVVLPRPPTVASPFEKQRRHVRHRSDPQQHAWRIFAEICSSSV
jgi:hypothetical protein